MQIKTRAAIACRFNARLCVALLLSSSLSPVGGVLLSSKAKADAVCITPSEFAFDGYGSVAALRTLSEGQTANLVGSDQGPGGFIKIPDTNGTVTFLVGELYQVNVEGVDPVTGGSVGTQSTVTSATQLLQPGFTYRSNFVLSGEPGFESTGAADAGAVGIISSGGAVAPLLGSVEVTNTDVQDLIRQRRELQQEQQVAFAETAPAASSQPDAQAVSEPPASAAKSSAKKTKNKVAISEPEVKSVPSQPSLSAEPDAEKDRWQSVWAQAFADYERHSNLAPGSGYDLTRKQETVGGITGGDVTYNRMGPHGTETLQLGLLGGGIHIRNRFSDTPTVTNATQTQDGGFIGAYAAYSVNNFAIDAFFKTDLLRLRQKSTTSGVPTCGQDQVLVVDSEEDLTAQQVNKDSTDEYIYTTGANMYYRFDLGDNVFFEPVAGFLFSATEFGGGAAGLGLDDGQMLRLQGGARIGRSWLDDTGHLWSLSLLGLLYSDVYVNGYTLGGSGLAVSASEVDEGKLRVLGQLEGSVELGNGLSLIGQANVRGGEDLFGVGGRFGARLEW